MYKEIKLNAVKCTE